MPFATHCGQRIHFNLQGTGDDVVVLQHGLLLDGASWDHSGFVQALADRFRVASVDSLGHGLNDKPDEAGLYVQEQRAGDIVAVLDAIGCKRAHLVGHSMGGWLAVGVAKYHPQRLASLVVGGWDVLSGLPNDANGPVRFEAFMAFARRTAPSLTQWVTSESEPDVRACFEALHQLEGARAAVFSAGVPVLLWNGRDDPAHDSMRAFAADEKLEFLSVEGDHLGVIFRHGATSASGIRSFLVSHSSFSTSK